MREDVNFNLISPGDTGGGYGLQPFIYLPLVFEFVIANSSTENKKSRTTEIFFNFVLPCIIV